MNLRVHAICTWIVALALIAGQAVAALVPTQPLRPEDGQIQTSAEVLRYLQKGHYRDMELDDRLSSQLLDRYIDQLDPSRSYFRSTDLTEFERYRHRFDDELRQGKLEAAFSLYNRYRERLRERLNFVLDRLKKPFDFDTQEALLVDREQAPWPATPTEQRDLWRRQIQNELITARLGGAEPAEAIERLERRYTSQLNRFSQIESQDAFQVFMDALTSTFDPHTQYFSPRLSENFQINMSLSLEGIGAVLTSEDEHTKVVRLVPKGPADKSGSLHPADRIVAVGQGEHGEMIDIIGWRLDDVVDLIRGKKDTVVRLQVVPSDAADGVPATVSIRRGQVKLEEQAAHHRIVEPEPGIQLGVISLPTFYLDFAAQRRGDANYKSTTRDVAKILDELKSAQVDGIVIDLRNNGGGSLQEANSLIGLFIRRGPTVQVQYSNGRIDLQGDPDEQVLYDGPLVVLVNRLSASASEIFAGAIQDYGRGLVVGDQTFGKGTVQSLVDLERGQLKMTLAKFYRVSGNSTQHRGVLPDIQFPSLIDPAEIGESALPNALPWDTVLPARYRSHGETGSALTLLTDAHQQRVQTDPELQYLIARTDLQNEVRGQQRVSLNLETRRAQREAVEQRRLALENTLRAARGEPSIDTVEALREEETVEPDAESESATADTPDAILDESGRILADYIRLQRKANDSLLPIAAASH
ncbi:MAG: carboxy terminal-processing peptidase [Pseudomonadota bacterium]|nr:carboxy terminal-processing peptidase [Pseudomonadota bacterium]